MGIALQTMTNELTLRIFTERRRVFTSDVFNANFIRFSLIDIASGSAKRSESTDGKKAEDFRQIPSGKIAAKHSDDGWSDWRNFNLCGDDFLQFRPSADLASSGGVGWWRNCWAN